MFPREVQVGSVRIRVCRKPNVTAGVDACGGHYQLSKSLISIDSTMSSERQWWRLAHEIGHAAFDVSGVDLRLAAAMGNEAAIAAEEEIVESVICANFLGSLRQLGVYRPGGVR